MKYYIHYSRHKPQKHYAKKPVAKDHILYYSIYTNIQFDKNRKMRQCLGLGYYGSWVWGRTANGYRLPLR
jgi:hypothetical protein